MCAAWLGSMAWSHSVFPQPAFGLRHRRPQPHCACWGRGLVRRPALTARRKRANFFSTVFCFPVLPKQGRASDLPARASGRGGGCRELTVLPEPARVTTHSVCHGNPRAFGWQRGSPVAANSFWLCWTQRQPVPEISVSLDTSSGAAHFSRS